MSSVLARAAAAAIVASGCLVCSAQAAVTPPPLPIGSAQVRPMPGLQEAERKRYVRAHHHKFEHKDPTRDDSVYGPVRTSGGPAAPGALQSAPAVSGGSAGAASPATGDAKSAGRVGGGKGASSWFYQQPQKK